MNTSFSQSYMGFLFAGAIIMAFASGAMAAYAAEFTVEIPQAAVAPGSELVADVWLDTQGESINALAGTLLFPADLIEASAIRDGGSLVTIWLEPPAAREAGRISFSGITPGGYAADRGFLFSVVFRATEEDVGIFSFSDMQAFKNDGEGTPALVSNVSVEFSVSAQAALSAPSEIADTEPPEPFVLELVENPLAFDGKKVLVFAAHDKSSGIARYEVCEGFFVLCVTAESPYVLARQSTDVLVRVNAFDHSGNMRVAYLYTPWAVARYASYGILAILALVGVFFAARRFIHR